MASNWGMNRNETSRNRIWYMGNMVRYSKKPYSEYLPHKIWYYGTMSDRDKKA